jgi:hypothetical protein
MLLALAHQFQVEAKDEQPLPFHHQLKKHFIMWRIRRITRRVLMEPFSSAFIKLYYSRCTQLFITYTGLNYESFELLLILFTPYFNKFTPYSNSGGIIRVRRKKGCKRMISALVCLGLVLTWTRTRGDVFCCSWTLGCPTAVSTCGFISACGLSSTFSKIIL